jgi:hypothetical protein
MKHKRQFQIYLDQHQAIKSQGYGKWVQEKLDQGWDAYFLSFMFNQLHGSKSSKLNQMKREIDRVYATMLSRIVRCPMSAKNAGRLPIWIGCPDFPVPKHQKQSLRDVTINDGLHYHAICLFPPDSRLRESLEDHVAEYQELYKGKAGNVRELHVRQIANSPKYVVDYTLKSIKRGRVSDAEIIILPRSRTELKDVSGNWVESYKPEEKYVTVRILRTEDGDVLL